MGNSDELEEFDAELEITLKREYKTVFPLFRYCVITQEATYLCNKLSVDCVPNASYLLFEIRMDDVWVWDRNRPTRIIPRAQIYTTSDVTVEQLKEDGDADLDTAIPQGIVEQLRKGLADSVVIEAGASDDEDDEDDSDGAAGAGPDVRTRETPDDMVGGSPGD